MVRRRRTKAFQLRLKEEELQQLAALADAEGCSAAEWVRRRIQQAGKPQAAGAPTPAKVPENPPPEPAQAQAVVPPPEPPSPVREVPPRTALSRLWTRQQMQAAVRQLKERGKERPVVVATLGAEAGEVYDQMEAGA